MQSLLSKAQKTDISTDPFPHLIVKDPLDAALAYQLLDEYPSLETITRGQEYFSNQFFSYSAIDTEEDTNISQTWQEFVKLHTSYDFMMQFLELFHDHIRHIYPSLLHKDISQWQVGLRKKDTFATSDMLLDGQICVNTPVTSASSIVKRVHVDLPNKLFNGLFYLRPPEDTTRSGNLELYQFKDQSCRYKFGPRQFIDERYVESVKTVNYRNNLLVIFFNSLDSLHAVSLREITNVPRRYFNILGEINIPLFDLEQHTHRSLWQALRSRLKKYEN